MIKEEDIVLCTVKKIEKTTVFVDIEGEGEGSIVMSEIAAGRIRNLREYVAPNKKIVCKVLKIINNHPQLSLRRVTAKERQKVIDRSRKERILISILKKVTKEYLKKFYKIKEEYEIPEFIEEARKDAKIIEKFFSRKESDKLSKLIKDKGEKEKKVREMFTIKSNSPEGVIDIKEILKTKDAKISYLGSSKFSIEITGRNFKEANKKIDGIIEQIEKKSKQKKAEFRIFEKRK